MPPAVRCLPALTRSARMIRETKWRPRLRGGDAVLISLLLVTACTVGPDWQKPEVPAPPAWRIEYAQAAELANARWWQAFGDPALDQLIEEALQNNRDLVQAAARVD